MINDDFVLDWEASSVSPFCFPISVCRGSLYNKDYILNNIKYNQFINYDSLECYRSDDLSKEDFCNSLNLQIIKNFRKVNDLLFEYDLTNLTPYVTSIWANRYTKQQYIGSHWHPNSWFSGVYYPYGTGTTEILFESPCGYLNIEPPRKRYNQYNSSTWKFTFPEDTMIFFPSYLRHQTFKHKDDIEKISLSFNIFLKGVVSEQTETKLIL